MKLDERQREILAVCACCGSKLDPDKSGDAIEEGLRPGQLMCKRCEEDPEHVAEIMVHLGTLYVSKLASDRCEEAGIWQEIEERAKRSNTEDRMRRDNQQN